MYINLLIFIKELISIQINLLADQKFIKNEQLLNLD